MNITAKITGIKYKVFLSDSLKEIYIFDFNINNCLSFSLFKENKYLFAILEVCFPKTHLFLSL